MKRRTALKALAATLGASTLSARPLFERSYPHAEPWVIKAMEVGRPFENSLAFAAIDATGQAHLAPVIRQRSGEMMALELENLLPEPTTLHWHGLTVDWLNDGHPKLAIPSGESRFFEFPVVNRGGTYWYHPHPHGRTAHQVYHGMGGVLLVEDDDSDRLAERFNLVMGLSDLTLMVQDRIVEDQQLVYSDLPHHSVQGFMGHEVLVNGRHNAVQKLPSRMVRLRLINGSNARIYRMALRQGARQLPFWLVATDGGLLREALPAEEVWLAPAERAEIMVDFGDLSIDGAVELVSLDFQNLILNGPPEPVPQGAPMHIMTLIPQRRLNVWHQTQFEVLSEWPEPDFSLAPVRNIFLDGNMAQFTIDGNVYEPDQAPIQAIRGTREVWHVNNATSVPHPMHLHAVPMVVLERRGTVQGYGQPIDGTGRRATDLGFKDTILVWPFEQVRVGIDWSLPFAGEQTYLFHCHNLEHEDQGMMVNVAVHDDA